MQIFNLEQGPYSVEVLLDQPLVSPSLMFSMGMQCLLLGCKVRVCSAHVPSTGKLDNEFKERTPVTHVN
jgi:hypothetical protein